MSGAEPAGARQVFGDAQQRLLERHGVEAHAQLLDVPCIGGRAQVLTSGEGPPVVMLNGIGTPGAMWAPLMAALDGLRLHVVDLPGYGLTDTHERVVREPRALAVDFLSEVLDRLGPTAPAFVANSLGSLWASWLALERPERVGRLVHVGCPALVLDSTAPLPMRLLAVPPLGRLLSRLQPPSPGQVEQVARTVRQHPLEPELVDLLVATGRLPACQQTFLPTLHRLLRLRGPRPEMRLTAEQLARIRAPTLLVWGADDPFGPPAVGERMRRCLPDAELHVVPGGHTPWLGEAARIAELAGPFLRAGAAGGGV